MGEIAEDMTDGTCCQLCGGYFMTEENQEKLGTEKESEATLFTHGYPVVCWDCYNDLTGIEKKQYRKAEVETL